MADELGVATAMSVTVKKEGRKLRFRHHGELFGPALLSAVIGLLTLVAFRSSLAATDEQSLADLFFVILGALFFLGGLCALWRSQGLLVVDGDSHRIEEGTTFVLLRTRSFNELGTVAVDACHDLYYDRNNGRPVIRRRRFMIKVTAPSGRHLFHIAEVSDYDEAMDLAQDVAETTGLVLRHPRRTHVMRVPLD